MKALENKLLDEVKRFREINKYTKKLMNEQDAPAVEPPLDPTLDTPPPVDGGLPPLPDATGDVPPMDTTTPPMDDMGMDNTEEIDITDLVNMTKNIKKDMDDKKMDDGNVITKMDDVFTKLNDLEQKLSFMDTIISKIDGLESKVEQMKPQTPEEKLEMRSLDSYPFNEKPQEFFAHKQDEMRASGKNEYVLTKDEVNDYSRDSLRNSFNPEEETDQEFKFQ